MKLNLSQIKDITTGAVRIEEINNTFHFYRFTKHQEELYKNRNTSFYLKTFSTSGVKMRFRTNSQSLFLNVDTASVTSRSFFAFEVFRLHPGKKQIMTLTNLFVRQDFFFLQ